MGPQNGWMDGSNIQWNILVKGWPIRGRYQKKKEEKQDKKNLRAHRRSPGRQDRVAAGPFPFRRRRRLRRPSI